MTKNEFRSRIMGCWMGKILAELWECQWNGKDVKIMLIIIHMI